MSHCANARPPPPVPSVLDRSRIGHPYPYTDSGRRLLIPFWYRPAPLRPSANGHPALTDLAGGPWQVPPHTIGKKTSQTTRFRTLFTDGIFHHSETRFPDLGDRPHLTDLAGGPWQVPPHTIGRKSSRTTRFRTLFPNGFFHHPKPDFRISTIGHTSIPVADAMSAGNMNTKAPSVGLGYDMGAGWGDFIYCILSARIWFLDQREYGKP